MVLPADLPIRVRLASRGEMFVTLDGAHGRHLKMGDELQVRTAPHRTVLLKNPDLDPFAILRQFWGAAPGVQTLYQRIYVLPRSGQPLKLVASS